MEASTFTLHGEAADRFAPELRETVAERVRRSINKRGIRNVHEYAGDGVTQLAYEQGAAFEESWVMVSVLVEQVDDRTCRVVVIVGGGGEGPFKLEDISMTRLLVGEADFGESGRYASVLGEIRRVYESLGLEVRTGSK